MMTMMALLLAVSVATAQRGQGNRGNDPLSELKLTTEQQAQIKAIKEEARAQMQEMRKQNPDQRPDRETMMKAREASQKKIEAVLTAEQREKLTALKTERKAAWEAVDKKGMKEALKAHNDTKVKPVITAARAQFDQFVSAEDKAALERLRPVFAAKPKGKAGQHRGKGKVSGEKPSETDLSAKKAAMETWKTDHSAEIAELKALAKKYADDLERIEDRMAPQREQWRKEKRAIMDSYLPENADKAKGKDSRARKGKGTQQRGEAHRKGKGKDKAEKGDWPKGTAFLLMKS